MSKNNNVEAFFKLNFKLIHYSFILLLRVAETVSMVNKMPSLFYYYSFENIIFQDTENEINLYFLVDFVIKLYFLYK